MLINLIMYAWYNNNIRVKDNYQNTFVVGINTQNTIFLKLHDS